MREIFPQAPAEWSFIEQISGLDRGLIFSLFYTHTLSTCRCPCVCPRRHSCHEAPVSPRSTRGFQAIVCSLSISAHPAVDTSHFGNCWVYRTFLHGCRGRRISSSGKKLSGACRQAETGIGQFTPREGFLFFLRSCWTAVSAGCRAPCGS